MLISEAYAQAAESGQAEAGWANLILLIGIFVIFWLLLIRPQAKRAKEHKQMVENLQRGDEVITNGGILGLILNVSESYVVVEIAPSLEVIVLKSSVQTLLPKGTLKSIEPSKGGKPAKKSVKASPAATGAETKKTDDATDSSDNAPESSNEDTSKPGDKN
ncbi:preprotein translocase subunit YajC [Nitrosomonas marina]|uniref:Sec translocon accessory complex subunit YajC n=1 Tax=Nitrosomonas marina TaxID=917 RepID=A0A1I0DDA3_9PROT|nr:preprotein translocase subunit YajC [Nitrosomonas marina]SET30097.1 preprotein translocase subunit YajC [Nitrosomonas marina]